MSLYREPGRRRLWPAALAVVALVLAFVLGFALGRATSDTSLEQAVEPVRTDTQEILAALELLALHYPEQGEPTDAELRAAHDQAARLEELTRDVHRDLAIIAPDDAARVNVAVSELTMLVRGSAPGYEVRDAIQSAEEAVRGLPTAG
jgi:hypothetical protein